MKEYNGSDMMALPKAPTILLAALAFAAGTSAMAQDGALRPAFGNTILSTHPDGRQAKLWLSEDHTFRAQGRKGNRSSGVWRVRGNKLCLTQRRPIPIPVSYCHRFPAVAVGARWKDTASNGDNVINQLLAGR